MLELNNISLQQIMQDISLDYPCGHDLREAKGVPLNLYHSVKDMRHNARTNENQNASAGESQFIKSSDWEPILLKSYELLSSYSKDMEVASWLVEALVRLYAFQGLSVGFKILTSLITKYYSSLYPMPDKRLPEEGEGSPSLAFLSGLVGGGGHEGTLYTPIQCASFSQNFMFCLWQFQKAYELEGIHDPKIKEEKIKSGAVLLQSIKTDINDSEISFLMSTKKYIEESLHNMDELSLALDKNFKDNSVSFSGIKTILQECQRTFAFLAGERLESIQQTKTSPKINIQKESVQDVVVETESNPYAEATKLLSEINFDCIFNPQKYSAPTLKQHTIMLINYLSQTIKVTDSLSPLPYFLDKAVQVSKLSFVEALNELKLAPHEMTVEAFAQLTGIKLVGAEKKA